MAEMRLYILFFGYNNKNPDGWGRLQRNYRHLRPSGVQISFPSRLKEGDAVQVIHDLLTRFPGRFAAELGIDLGSGPEARQRWFLAAILYGGRISGQLAARTYRVFAARGIFTPEAILAQGWDNLVILLDEGGYTRYDFKTATKLLQVMGNLQEDYQGAVERVHELSESYPELEERLEALGTGIGPTTVNIFLRELRGIWAKATPPLSPLAHRAAEHRGLIPSKLTPEEALDALTSEWQAQPVQGYDLADLEAALVRLGLELRHQQRQKQN
jgi:endonuclease III